MEAPEKIWVQEGTGYEGDDILIAQDGSEVWDKDFATEYIRADLIPAMLAAEREKALREAAAIPAVICHAIRQNLASPKVSNPDHADDLAEVADVCYGAILSLIQKDVEMSTTE